MKLKTLLVLIFPAFFFSCITVPKDIVYFQDMDKYPQNMRIASDSTSYDLVIKKNDELKITISSPTLDQEAVAQFNLPPIAFLSADETNAQKTASIQTYIVDKNGNINFPVIGQITLAGLSKSQATELIKKSISKYISDPIVNIRILSFKVIVLGEVKAPGPQYASLERMSILDAIGYAGDLSLYGNRKNVLLIRENDNGTTDHVRFDLTSSDIFTSPYFYLQQNDKIIVEPNKTRQLESKYGIADGYKFSMYSMAFSVISIILTTTVTIISLKK